MPGLGGRRSGEATDFQDPGEAVFIRQVQAGRDKLVLSVAHVVRLIQFPESIVGKLDGPSCPEPDLSWKAPLGAVKWRKRIGFPSFASFSFCSSKVSCLFCLDSTSVYLLTSLDPAQDPPDGEIPHPLALSIISILPPAQPQTELEAHLTMDASSSSSAHLAAGSPRFIDNGDIELISIIGTGAYGVVYLAIDSRYGTPAYRAVKCLRRNGLDSRQRHFQRREIALHRLASAHPSIITMDRLIEEGDYLYVVMDYGEEGDLFAMITDRQRVREFPSELGLELMVSSILGMTT